MYTEIVLTTFVFSWTFERFYYYYHKNGPDNGYNSGLLNLNINKSLKTPLANSNNSEYIPIDPENRKKTYEVKEDETIL